MQLLKRLSARVAPALQNLSGGSAGLVLGDTGRKSQWDEVPQSRGSVLVTAAPLCRRASACILFRKGLRTVFFQRCIQVFEK